MFVLWDCDQDYAETTGCITMKLGLRMFYGSRTNPLNSGVEPDQGGGSGFLLVISLVSLIKR